jgi:2-keto-4-pentenoate hydratase
MNAAAASLIDARRRNVQTALPPVASEADAYAIQDAVAASWTAAGDRIGAWKAGAPNATTTPSASPIAASTVRPSPVSLPAVRFHVIGVEAELAYRFERDLPARNRPYTTDEVLAAVASMHVAIEVCDTRLAGWKTADAYTKLADNQLNAALVVGDPVQGWRQVAYAGQRCELIVDGKVEKDTTGSHALVDPTPLLPWIVAHCIARNAPLRAGDIVTTGSWNGMVFVEPGASVVVRFPGLGEAKVDFPKG